MTDTAIQVVGGPAFAGAGDDVSANDKVLPNGFPFEATPWDGRNRVAPEPVNAIADDRAGDGGGTRRRRHLARRRAPERRSSPAAQAARRRRRREPSRRGCSAVGDTAALVSAARDERLRANPRDAQGYALLGLAYQQRARETGDPTYYTKSERGAATARCALAPRDLIATSGLGSLALSRHRFREALGSRPRARCDLADDGAQLRRDRRRARRARPLPTRRSGPSTRWRSCEPSVSSYARISYARELLGDRAGAIAAMPLALDAAGGQRETDGLDARPARQARLVGRPDRARRAARTAPRCAAFPGYAYALDALALGRGGAGHAPRARSRSSSEAVDAHPAAAVRRDARRPLRSARAARGQARRQYALIGVIQRLLVANGVKHRPRDGALRRRPRHPAAARRSRSRAGAQRERPSIDGDDVLAWALARNGHCGEALRYSQARAPARHARRAQALPPRDDRALPRQPGRGAALVRAGRCALNPHFSVLWAPVARKAAAMKRLVLLLAVAAALARAGGRGRAPARQLHDQPLQPRRGLGPPRSTSSTCSTWPRSRPSRPAASTPQRLRAADRRGTRTSTVDGRPVALVPLGHALAHPPGAGGLRTTRLEVVLARAASSTARRRRLPRHELRRPDRLEGDRGRRATRRAAATSSAPTRRTCSRARSTSTSRHGDARARRRRRRRRRRSRAARRSQAPDRVADAGFASLVGRSHLSAAA